MAHEGFLIRDLVPLNQVEVFPDFFGVIFELLTNFFDFNELVIEDFPTAYFDQCLLRKS